MVKKWGITRDKRASEKATVGNKKYFKNLQDYSRNPGAGARETTAKGESLMEAGTLKHTKSRRGNLDRTGRKRKRYLRNMARETQGHFLSLAHYELE